MPASGPTLPAAMRTSAMRAPSSALSPSTVRNALSLGLSASMRESVVRVSSTLDTRFSTSERESSDKDAAATTISLDDLGHQVQPVVNRRCALLIERVAVGLAHAVLAQRRGDLLRMRHRHDTRRVHRAHLVDEVEDSVELALHVLRLGRRDLDAGEVGDALDVLDGESHARALRQSATFGSFPPLFEGKRCGSEAY